ncbi:MAG: polysaccharide deacetylase family protein, partial [Gaiellaceae bacterium]
AAALPGAGPAFPLPRAVGRDALQLPRVLPHRTLSVPILMYHRVGPVSRAEPAITEALTVTPPVFAAEMAWLQRAGFHTITAGMLFRALELGGRLPPRPVLITFDDGYRDVLWHAAPVLHRLRMHAVAFVIAGRVSGRDPSFLTWAELRRLELLGVAIGSHTVHHLELAHISRARATYELDASRLMLERRLGHSVDWLAYPAGSVDAGVLPLVRRAGYLLAVTTRGGDRQSAREPFLLHREEILDTTGVRGLAALLGR